MRTIIPGRPGQKNLEECYKQDPDPIREIVSFPDQGKSGSVRLGIAEETIHFRIRRQVLMAKKTQAKENVEFSEAQIAVHWKEEGYFQPPKKFVAQANMKDKDVRKRFGLKNFPNCFREYADMLTWFEPYRTVLDASKPPFWKWFVGGKINASYNCVDRHLGQYRNKAALIFVPEPEDEPTIALTYQELYVRVNEMAALLRDFCGLKAGDRVTLHLPMTLELPVTMLACARLGVIHSQVFGGFSGQACGA